MEVEINIGGMAAKVTVRDAAEAVSFLSSMAANRESVKHVHAPVTPGTPVMAVQHSAPPAMDVALRDAIERLRGTTTAKVVACLAKESTGMSDDEIRDTIEQPELNLGPIFATLTKACARSGINNSDMYTKNQSRSGGMNVYHYRLTQLAIRAVESIPGFPG